PRLRGIGERPPALGNVRGWVVRDILEYPLPPTIQVVRADEEFPERFRSHLVGFSLVFPQLALESRQPADDSRTAADRLDRLGALTALRWSAKPRPCRFDTIAVLLHQCERFEAHQVRERILDHFALVLRGR